MKNLLTALRTNENGARTKALVATGITAAAIAAGVYLTKKNAQVPVVLLVEETADVITDATQS